MRWPPRGDALIATIDARLALQEARRDRGSRQRTEGDGNGKASRGAPAAEAVLQGRDGGWTCREQGGQSSVALDASFSTARPCARRPRRCWPCRRGRWRGDRGGMGGAGRADRSRHHAAHQARQLSHRRRARARGGRARGYRQVRRRAICCATGRTRPTRWCGGRPRLWDPILAWSRDTLGARLCRGRGPDARGAARRRQGRAGAGARPASTHSRWRHCTS